MQTWNLLFIFAQPRHTCLMGVILVYTLNINGTLITSKGVLLWMMNYDYPTDSVMSWSLFSIIKTLHASFAFCLSFCITVISAVYFDLYPDVFILNFLLIYQPFIANLLWTPKKYYSVIFSLCLDTSTKRFLVIFFFQTKVYTPDFEAVLPCPTWWFNLISSYLYLVSPTSVLSTTCSFSYYVTLVSILSLMK